MRRVHGVLVPTLLCLAALATTACETPRGPQGERSADRPRSSSPGESSPALGRQFVLASSFERPVCGVWWRPDAGCEFGVEGDVEGGEFSCRTGDRCVRLQRLNRETHVGVLAPAPAPGGRAFVGLAHRIPAIPAGAIPERPGYVELEQLTPTDGALPGWPVEVRLYPDRTLGLGLSQVDDAAGDAVVMTDWRAPVDEWFYVVVEISNGSPATQRMWVFGPDDRLVERVSVELTTRIAWVHATRTAQKVGGRTSTEVPMLTFADDWYVASTFEGPLHIGPEGEPLEG